MILASRSITTVQIKHSKFDICPQLNAQHSCY